MVRDPVFGTMLDTYCRRIGAVYPPEDEDRQTAVFGWVCEPAPLLHRTIQTGRDRQETFAKLRDPLRFSRAHHRLADCCQISFAPLLQRTLDQLSTACLSILIGFLQTLAEFLAYGHQGAARDDTA